MNEIATGRCLCGEVAYRYVGEIGPANYCHCADCRRHTGSAFNIGVRLRRATFELIGATPRVFAKRGDSGNAISRHFCPNCGSPIFTSSALHPDHVYVKSGTLDNPSLVRPSHQIWLDSAVPWSIISPHLPGFKRGTDLGAFRCGLP